MKSCDLDSFLVPRLAKGAHLPTSTPMYVPLYCPQMEQSFSMQINMGLAQDGESDEVGGPHGGRLHAHAHMHVSSQLCGSCLPPPYFTPCVNTLQLRLLHVCGFEHVEIRT